MKPIEALETIVAISKAIPEEKWTPLEGALFDIAQTALQEHAIIGNLGVSCACGAKGVVYQLPNGSWLCYSCFSMMEMQL